MPMMLVRRKGPGSSIDRSTCDSAAKWTTTSQPAITSSMAASSQMSASTTVIRSATGARLDRCPA